MQASTTRPLFIARRQEIAKQLNDSIQHIHSAIPGIIAEDKSDLAVALAKHYSTHADPIIKRILENDAKLTVADIQKAKQDAFNYIRLRAPKKTTIHQTVAHAFDLYEILFLRRTLLAHALDEKQSHQLRTQLDDLRDRNHRLTNIQNPEQLRNVAGLAVDSLKRLERKFIEEAAKFQISAADEKQFTEEFKINMSEDIFRQQGIFESKLLDLPLSTANDSLTRISKDYKAIDKTLVELSAGMNRFSIEELESKLTALEQLVNSDEKYPDVSAITRTIDDTKAAVTEWKLLDTDPLLDATFAARDAQNRYQRVRDEIKTQLNSATQNISEGTLLLDGKYTPLLQDVHKSLELTQKRFQASMADLIAKGKKRSKRTPWIGFAPPIEALDKFLTQQVFDATGKDLALETARMTEFLRLQSIHLLHYTLTEALAKSHFEIQDAKEQKHAATIKSRAYDAANQRFAAAYKAISQRILQTAHTSEIKEFDRLKASSLSLVNAHAAQAQTLQTQLDKVKQEKAALKTAVVQLRQQIDARKEAALRAQVAPMDRRSPSPQRPSLKIDVQSPRKNSLTQSFLPRKIVAPPKGSFWKAFGWSALTVLLAGATAAASVIFSPFSAFGAVPTLACARKAKAEISKYRAYNKFLATNTYSNSPTRSTVVSDGDSPNTDSRTSIPSPSPTNGLVSIRMHTPPDEGNALSTSPPGVDVVDVQRRKVAPRTRHNRSVGARQRMYKPALRIDVDAEPIDQTEESNVAARNVSPAR
jgi:hypothetical protein